MQARHSITIDILEILKSFTRTRQVLFIEDKFVIRYVAGLFIVTKHPVVDIRHCDSRKEGLQSGVTLKTSTANNRKPLWYLSPIFGWQSAMCNVCNVSVGVVSYVWSLCERIIIFLITRLRSGRSNELFITWTSLKTWPFSSFVTTKPLFCYTWPAPLQIIWRVHRVCVTVPDRKSRELSNN